MKLQRGITKLFNRFIVMLVLRDVCWFYIDMSPYWLLGNLSPATGSRSPAASAGGLVVLSTMHVIIFQNRRAIEGEGFASGGGFVRTANAPPDANRSVDGRMPRITMPRPRQ